MQPSQWQKDFLENFECERLTHKLENKKLLENFTNNRASYEVLRRFKEDAWEQDKDGEIAYYIVKYKDTGIVLLFALKCGVVFTLLDKNVTAYKNIKELLQYEYGNSNLNIDEKIIEEILQLSTLAQGDLYDLLNKIKIRICPTSSQLELIQDLKDDKEMDNNVHMQRVNETYSAVELPYFYINDAIKEKIKQLFDNYKIDHAIGQVLFWKFVVPVVQKIPKIVGCEYLFLFAADSSKNKTLVNYYSSLKFEAKDQVGTNKPSFDFLCKFMYQKISSLEEKRTIFFNNFNLDDGV